MTCLCVPITATTCEAMARDASAAAAAGAELIELRLDYLDLNEPTERFHEPLGQIHERLKGRIIFTCRAAEEGGHYREDESKRVKLLLLLGGGAPDSYFDLEYRSWKRSPELQALSGFRLILSRHDFENTPADLDAMLAEIATEPCQVAKIACKANTITDTLRTLDALRASLLRKPTIALSMGETGIITRVLARKFGAFLTFASLEEGKESAPGQVSISQMKNLYRWDTLNERTKVYGVIGCPVAHSMSPAIHNAAFSSAGHDGVYLPMRVEPDYESFSAWVDGCMARPWLDVCGFSVTIPHKENLLRYVQEHGGWIEPLAQRIGVANTLVIGEGERGRGGEGESSRPGNPAQGISPPHPPAHSPLLYAYNTDYSGALDALCEGLDCTRDDLADLSVTVLGAGGAARGIVAGLLDCGCRVTLYNRTDVRARRLAGEFGCVAAPWEQRGRLHADVIINCTSLGMWPRVEETPLPAGLLAGRPVVFDTIYNPMETRLLREAREAGCRTIDGVAMFVNQAAAQFELWTQQTAPRNLMREVVIRRLSS